MAKRVLVVTPATEAALALLAQLVSPAVRVNQVHLELSVQRESEAVMALPEGRDQEEASAVTDKRERPGLVDLRDPLAQQDHVVLREMTAHRVCVVATVIEDLTAPVVHLASKANKDELEKSAERQRRAPAETRENMATRAERESQVPMAFQETEELTVLRVHAVVMQRMVLMGKTVLQVLTAMTEHKADRDQPVLVV